MKKGKNINKFLYFYLNIVVLMKMGFKTSFNYDILIIESRGIHEIRWKGSNRYWWC